MEKPEMQKEGSIDAVPQKDRPLLYILSIFR